MSLRGKGAEAPSRHAGRLAGACAREEERTAGGLPGRGAAAVSSSLPRGIFYVVHAYGPGLLYIPPNDPESPQMEPMGYVLTERGDVMQRRAREFVYARYTSVVFFPVEKCADYRESVATFCKKHAGFYWMTDFKTRWGEVCNV